MPHHACGNHSKAVFPRDLTRIVRHQSVQHTRRNRGPERMKKASVLLLSALFVAGPCVAQNLAARIDAMKSSYALSGNIIVVDDHTIVIEPKMPGPLCALPKIQDGKTVWSFYTFPISSIVVPLASIDETLIAEDAVFTRPDAPQAYKPGDVGDTTMVVVAGVAGKQFHTLLYDRDKFTRLGPGPHSPTAYGQTPDDTQAFGLTFSDRASARAFEIALRDAVVMAKSQQVARQ